MLVVLPLKVGRVYGHIVLHTTQEEQSDLIPTCLPSCLYADRMVDRCEVGSGRLQ